MKLTLLMLICVAICHGKSIKPKQSAKLPFEFDDVVNSGKFSQRGFGGVWISGNEFTYTSSGNFVKHNVETNQTETILSSEFIGQQSWRNPTFRYSPDRSKILVRYAVTQVFRHSTVSKFSVIKPGTTEPELKIANGDDIQTAFFSPKSNGLAYIFENNVYYMDLDSSETAVTITTDGVPGIIYNGIPDWVYEEEVLGTDAASWISPDDKHLAFIRFDDTNVQEFVYDLYGEGELQYAEEVKLRYPKAGTTNPTVALIVVELANPTNRRTLAVPTDKVNADHILGTVFWISEQSLGAIWLNRRQNRGVFVSYDTQNNFAMNELLEISEPNGWIDVNTPKCDDNSVCYFVNNNDNWPSLTKINTRNGNVEHLTYSMNVLSVYGIRDNIPYFLSTPSPLKSFDRHVYTSNGCLTCAVETPEGNLCSYASASFSKDLSHYTMTCSGPNPSFAKIFKSDGNVELAVWEDNANLRATLSAYHLPETRIFHVPVAGGFNAAVKMQVPAGVDFDNNDSSEKYPMVVRVYGGPGSVRIASSHGVGYQTYQTTKKNIIYVEIDGRGTGQKGLNMMFSVNNRLGTFEMEDQLAVTKYLTNQYKFIDSSRVGIWGWSYGGYATAMTLAQDTEKVMKCGISVAPVTSWRFYDTIYTERYMGINSNATNYSDSEVFSKDYVKTIGEHEFFLIHGNADDNVHYQQSMVLARELELADIMFDQLSYPDEAHSISGTQKHLYHSMDRFWDRCFKK